MKFAKKSVLKFKAMLGNPLISLPFANIYAKPPINLFLKSQDLNRIYIKYKQATLWLEDPTIISNST